jgi:hypothetical protein
MRKISVITGFLLVMAIVAGCGTVAIAPAQTPAQAPSQNTTQTITGTVQSVTATDNQGTVVVSIKTNTGTQNISVTKNTTVSVEGQACTIDDINLFNIQGQSYNCTTVFNGCDGNAIAFNVVKIVN